MRTNYLNDSINVIYLLLRRCDDMLSNILMTTAYKLHIYIYICNDTDKYNITTSSTICFHGSKLVHCTLWMRVKSTHRTIKLKLSRMVWQLHRIDSWFPTLKFLLKEIYIFFFFFFFWGGGIYRESFDFPKKSNKYARQSWDPFL